MAMSLEAQSLSDRTEWRAPMLLPMSRACSANYDAYSQKRSINEMLHVSLLFPCEVGLPSIVFLGEKLCSPQLYSRLFRACIVGSHAGCRGGPLAACANMWNRAIDSWNRS